MIVPINAKNQRECFNDDQRRLKAKLPLHYSVGTHVHVLIIRVERLEKQLAQLLAAQGMSAFGQDPQGLEAKPASPVLPQEGCAQSSFHPTRSIKQ